MLMWSFVYVYREGFVHPQTLQGFRVTLEKSAENSAAPALFCKVKGIKERLV